MHVFISVGRVWRPEQQAFVAELRAFLLGRGVNPRSVDANSTAAVAPLRAIQEATAASAGMIVVAFERRRIEKGTEMNDAIGNVRIPTVWNQIEAGMGYATGKPLLIIKEPGLTDEGLLEGRYDWRVLETDIKAGAVNEEPLRGVLIDWIDRLEKQGEGGGRTTSLEKHAELLALLPDLSVGPLFRAASARQLISVALAVAALLATGASIGYFMPQVYALLSGS